MSTALSYWAEAAALGPAWLAPGSADWSPAGDAAPSRLSSNGKGSYEAPFGVRSEIDGFSLAQRRRVLVVEDEALVALSVCDALSDIGLEVVAVVARAEDAIAKAYSMRPHLVMMDVRLQGARDGIWACSLILAAHDLPVIFMTACQDNASLVRLRAVPSAAIMFKPFSIPTLTRTVLRTMRDFYVA
jgi:CheY-like chemotaxis protein